MAKFRQPPNSAAEATIVSKNITANGTYNASADSADGYNPVTVAVPEKTIVSKSITANGTYNASSDSADGYNPVTVAVPEKTIVSKSIIANGTYNASADSADGYDPVTVNVPFSRQFDFMQFVTNTNMNLGVGLNIDYEYEIEFDVTNYRDYNVIFGMSENGPNTLNLVQYNNKYYTYNGNSEVTLSQSLTGKHTIKFLSTGMYFDDVYITSFTPFIKSGNIYIGYRNDLPTQGGYNGKINRFTIKSISSGNILYNFVPYVREYNGIVQCGILETINNTIILSSLDIGNYID